MDVRYFVLFPQITQIYTDVCGYFFDKRGYPALKSLILFNGLLKIFIFFCLDPFRMTSSGDIDRNKSVKFFLYIFSPLR